MFNPFYDNPFFKQANHKVKMVNKNVLIEGFEVDILELQEVNWSKRWFVIPIGSSVKLDGFKKYSNKMYIFTDGLLTSDELQNYVVYDDKAYELSLEGDFKDWGFVSYVLNGLDKETTRAVGRDL